MLVIDNPESGIWTSGTAWRLEEDLRIGVPDGDPVREFGRVSDIAVDESGRIYVLDRQAAEIRVFDHDGEFVRTFGRPGGGPGELASPSAVLIGAADTVFIPGAAKYDVFDREGRFLGVIATPDRFQPMQADAEHIYGVSRDDLGAQRVARLRVRR